MVLLKVMGHYGQALRFQETLAVPSVSLLLVYRCALLATTPVLCLPAITLLAMIVIDFMPLEL